MQPILRPRHLAGRARWSALLILGGLLVAGCTSPPAGDVHIQDIHGLALDPVNPKRLLVATHHGLFAAEDDTRWTAVTTEAFDMMGFTVHPRDPNVMYASGHPGGVGQGWAVGLVRSTDGGRTWTTLSLRNEVDFHALAMEAGTDGANTVYGYFKGRFYTSVDGGATWRSAPVPFVAAALAVEPTTGTVYAATDQGIQRTGPRGSGGWTAVTPGNALGVAVSAADPFFVVAYFANGGLKASKDGGAHWASLNWTAPADDHPWGLALHATDKGTLYAGTARGKIFKTEDGGSHWSIVRK